MFDRNTMYADLTKYVCNVAFEKIDGTMRQMRCTLIPTYILNEQKETHVPRKQSDEVLAVWDLDKNAWRSFRIDSVLNYSIMENTDAAST
jgi:hypothetical protein